MVLAARCDHFMPAMENSYQDTRQPVVAVFPAPQVFPAALYNIPPAAQPPPPPKWPHFKNLQGKRGGYSNKHKTRIPSTKVNINRIRKQNAQGTRGYFGKGTSSRFNFDSNFESMHFQRHLTQTWLLIGTRAEAPRTVPPAPYNSNGYLSNQSGKT